MSCCDMYLLTFLLEFGLYVLRRRVLCTYHSIVASHPSPLTMYTALARLCVEETHPYNNKSQQREVDVISAELSCSAQATKMDEHTMSLNFYQSKVRGKENRTNLKLRERNYFKLKVPSRHLL